MTNSSGRREFLKKLGVGSLGASVLPGTVTAEQKTADSKDENVTRIQTNGHTFNGDYSGEYLRYVAMPIGGMGSGMFCIEGTGTISHMSVRNKPDVFNEPLTFAAVGIKGDQTKARILEGAVPDWKGFGLHNNRIMNGGTTYGLPHFETAVFNARFPFATISLEEANHPLKVSIMGWSPFVPGDADNSSLPVGAIEYTLRNVSGKPLEGVFSFHSRNFMKIDDGDENKRGKDSVNRFKNGFVLANQASDGAPHQQGEFAIFTNDENVVIDHCWFRGGWFDPLTMTWQSIRDAVVKKNEPVDTGAPGASFYSPFTLGSNEEKVFRVMMTWFVPESDLRIGREPKPDDKCMPGDGCCDTTAGLGIPIADASYSGGNFKPWYTSRFKNIQEAGDYWLKNYTDLQKKSALFRDSFYSSTLPAEVVEAVAANLTILKSPTVLRQFDGRLWSWEGCGDTWGCCHGSCTHVWNYAQAIPHLFPEMERTLRHSEFCESQSRTGHQTFRTAIPIRPVDHEFYAAADGQLGGIMKAYREWRISGDAEWLKKMYPMVKNSMDYCISTWDPESRGVVEEPHHNTYDIEFWGPDGMCTGFYLGALSAMIAMATFLKKKKDAVTYNEIYDNGRKFMESALFDGEYFIQKIQIEGLKAPNPIEASAKSMGGEYSDEAKELLKKEGPKYQYGTGCLSDGVLGGWMARTSGLPDPFDGMKTRSHLVAVHKHNFKKDLSEHANPQRPGYAFGKEGGLLLCSWPKGGRLSLPFVYSDEVWTGIEYQVASHLMLMGEVEKGLDIVRACRKRYDGRTRNPFNEYECGHWYARALSSYGLLQGLTGVRFDAVDKILYVDSKVGDFTSFLATNTGYGTVSLKNGKVSLNVASGTIPVAKISTAGKLTSPG